MGVSSPNDVGDLPVEGLGNGRGEEERVGDPDVLLSVAPSIESVMVGSEVVMMVASTAIRDEGEEAER